MASAPSNDAEFLWLISLSDLMILLFVFFVALFSLNYKKAHSIDDIQRRLTKWTLDRRLLNDVSVSRNDTSLILEIKEQVLFPSGAHHVRPESRELIAHLARALSQIPAPFRLGIEGHTDDAAPRTMTNWELSSKRALAVLGEMHLDAELLKRTVVMGYAGTHPLAPNRDGQGRALPANQAKNRRVTIRVW